MSRYIDADLLVRWICGNKCGCERNECGFTIPCQQVQTLEGAPSIDIVRCGECKAHNDVNMNPAHIMCGYMSDDDFCSYGKRSDDE